MVHLGPTPGAPAHDGTTGWLDRAVEDAAALVEAGFGAVLVENFGDKPFFAGRVPPETVAAVTHAAARVRERLPAGTALGINVLRNDAEAALAVAAAVGADFIRVNVLAGAAVTDQGVIEGRAADVVRMRARLAPSVRIFADLRVKHARPLVERSLAGEARELVERAGADAVIVSGSATGRPVDMGKLAAVRSAVGSHPVLVGSGATVESMGDLLEHADGVIVGTAIKAGGVTTAPVDVERARAFVMAGRIGRRGA
ncbi:MAG: BtpA/SgcQ family protein [Planctomycetota bacterium]|nr:BtpA/SgcQ family protein [Planctomycetota bacterium]